MKIAFAIIAIIIFVVGIFIVVIYKNVNSLRRIDGVKDINGIRYIVRNVSVAYVMGRLEAVRMSEIVESKEFEKLGENKGRNRHWAKPDFEYIGPKLNQAYHRWFKEILDLEVYKEP